MFVNSFVYLLLRYPPFVVVVRLNVNVHYSTIIIGVAYAQSTIDNGRRMSTAQTYLALAKHRKNLTIRTVAQVTRVLFEQNRAKGVSFIDVDGVVRSVLPLFFCFDNDTDAICVYCNLQQTKQVFARKEVILSAGAVGSPHILMLSGIGPCDELKKHGIDCIYNSPYVGKNLLDHMFVVEMFGTNKKLGVAPEDIVRNDAS